MFGERCCEKVCLGGVAVNKCVPGGVFVRSACVRGGVSVRKLYHHIMIEHPMISFHTLVGRSDTTI